MEGVLGGIGITALVILAVIGFAVGAALGMLLRRGVLLYGIIGAVAAMAAPFVLALLGVTVLAAGGVVLLLVVGAVAAAAVVALVRAVSGKR
ncbi:GlsB/YeaQ/YmgE family stress response membrane protein [Jannaschia sp. LMIT008]|uniref:GlsB/YeaQ/YmgE family stress response membrane protein n=1 Tax=Jannaschia maritima TaxID=3032585 RepID=UPI00281190CE|nr:GlsB/YeaQ/YmgE family stress response membrane protein [Jannaschia sp. LMIT008]